MDQVPPIKEDGSSVDDWKVGRSSILLLLPSLALLLGEAPDEAAKRILKEQLALVGERLEARTVFFEVYGKDNQ